MSVLDEASLVLIPSGYKSGKLYSVVPSDGSGDLDFSRSTTATRVNESGLIETVGINVPRIDFTGGGCGKALIEPQKTNLLKYSKDFSNANWIKYGSTIIDNSTTSPDGYVNASKMSETATLGIHTISSSAVSATGAYTATVFFKKGTRQYFSIKLLLGSGWYTQVFDAVGLVTGSSNENGLTSLSSEIVSVGNGWVRASVSATSATSGTAYVLPSLSDSATPTFNPSNYNPSYTGSTSEYGYFWGAQLEQGSYPTSYIPTAGTSVTRAQDLSVTTGLSDQIGSDEGLILLDAKAFINGGSNRVFTIGDGTYQNYISMFYHNSANRFDTLAVKSGSILAVKNLFSLTHSDRNIIAIRYKTDSYDLWVNGASQGIVTGMGAFFAANLLTNVQFTNTIGSSPMQGKVNEMLLMKTYPTDIQMAELTTL